MIAFNCNALTLIVGTWWLDTEGKWLGPTFECRLLSQPITPAYIGSWLHWLDLLSRKQRYCVGLAFMIHSFKDIIHILLSVFCSLSCKNNYIYFLCSLYTQYVTVSAQKTVKSYVYRHRRCFWGGLSLSWIILFLRLFRLQRTNIFW